MKRKDRFKIIDLAAFLARKKQEENNKNNGKTKKDSSKKTSSHRNKLIAKVKISQKQIGINDADYRVLLDVNFGVSSCTELDDQGLVRLTSFLQSKCWTDRPAQVPDRHGRPITLTYGVGRPTEPIMRKIEALLCELGKVKGEYIPWDYAASILKRQTGCNCLDATDVQALGNVVAALNNTLKSARRKAECKTK